MAEVVPTGDQVHGLDPRALLARATQPLDLAALLRAWAPPSVEELGALFPKLEVIAMIGRGGMGAVYRARQPSLNREVAVKLLPGEVAADDAFAARFAAEARALAALQHPHIVAIYEYGQTSAGHLFFLMEYVDGPDLARLIATRELPPARALAVASRVCEALQFAHERGVIHRDIKPANVLVGRDGAVKVADFGLAQWRSEADVADSRLTTAGTVIGTPDYMAPEQRAGRTLDARADIYSLGVMLYEMLTGELPRGAWEAPSRKVPTDARLDGVVTKAMQTEPENRFQEVSEVRRRVDEIRASRFPRKRIVGIVAAVAVVAGLIGGVALVPREKMRTPVPPTEEEMIEPLRALDLRQESVAGDWQWGAGGLGEILRLERTSTHSAKRLRLPVRPGAGGYELSCRLLLEDNLSDAGIILRTGRTRVGLVLNLQGSSGLGLVDGERWRRNSSSTTERAPVGRGCRLDIAVRPEGDQVSVSVRIDGVTFIRWKGAQSELSLYEAPPLGWAMPDDDSLGLASYSGGIEISDVQVRLLK